jgi:hypothetical protein
MQLVHYPTLHGITVPAFGKQIGKPQPIVTRYIQGLRLPEAGAPRTIARAISGTAAPNDFHPWRRVRGTTSPVFTGRLEAAAG